MNMLVLGLISGLALFLCLIGAFILGFKYGKKLKQTNMPQPTEEQLKKAKLMREGWQNILNYDINVAMGKGRE